MCCDVLSPAEASATCLQRRNTQWRRKTMGILDKLLRRKPDHEAWLKANPGKRKVTMDAPDISAAESASMRSRMESELDEQRNKRDNA